MIKGADECTEKQKTNTLNNEEKQKAMSNRIPTIIGKKKMKRTRIAIIIRSRGNTMTMESGWCLDKNEVTKKEATARW